MTQTDPQRSDREVTVEVFVPRFTEGKSFTWPLDLTVGQAAQQAATAFGYQGGNPTLGRLAPDITFDRTKTLQQEHVHEHEKLELLDVGGGV